MPFKYQSQIDQFNNCDLSSFSGQDRQAFRWVFADIQDQRNFLPRFLLNDTAVRDKCIGWALSFFETQEKAKNRLLRLTRNKENLFKKLGTHIATGQLATVDGISDACDELGHFSHFEYENINLNPRFTIVEQIAG